MESILDPSTSYNIHKKLLIFQCIGIGMWYFCPINTSENLYHHSSHKSQKKMKKTLQCFSVLFLGTSCLACVRCSSAPTHLIETISSPWSSAGAWERPIHLNQACLDGGTSRTYRKGPEKTVMWGKFSHWPSIPQIAFWSLLKVLSVILV